MIRPHKTVLLSVLSLSLGLWAVSARGQTQEDQIVNAATAILNETMAIPAKQIPQSLLANARGVAIIPNVVKGGFVLGIRHGRGVVLIRDDAGNWQPPRFATLTGGSIGWQAGIQATDVILVFKTRRSVDGLMTGKLTIGVDAAGAAGPVGRQATASTDATLGAEIYSYSKSRGLFAGVSFDGSAIQLDQLAGTAYYRHNVVPVAGVPARVPAAIPQSAVQLMGRLAHYSGAPGVAPQQAQVATREAATPTTEPTRQRLISSWQVLSALMDDNWRAYLQLPPDVITPGRTVSKVDLDRTVLRYDVVAQDPRYASLAQHAEFVNTHRLLREYVQSQATPSKPLLTLPPPPRDAGDRGSNGRY